MEKARKVGKQKWDGSLLHKLTKDRAVERRNARWTSTNELPGERGKRSKIRSKKDTRRNGKCARREKKEGKLLGKQELE